MLNQLAQEIHTISRQHGFYDTPEGRNQPEMIALIHSELSEALEYLRKPGPDKHLPHRSGFEVELADAIIRILDMAAYLNLDMEGAVQEKVAFNRTRPYKHGKAF